MSFINLHSKNSVQIYIYKLLTITIAYHLLTKRNNSYICQPIKKIYMIQRIQSIYLVLAALVYATMLKLPLVEMLTEESGTVRYLVQGFTDSNNTVIASTIALKVLVIAITLFATFSIFLFKKRPLQIRLTIYSILLSLGFYGLLFFYLGDFKKQLTVTSSAFQAGIVFPLVGIILLFLAFRGIQKDDALVKSYDRLR